MTKNLNKVRDMKHAKYNRCIKGDKRLLKAIARVYQHLDPYMIEDFKYDYDEDGNRIVISETYKLRFWVEFSVWQEIVEDLELVVDKNVPQKREWWIV